MKLCNRPKSLRNLILFFALSRRNDNFAVAFNDRPPHTVRFTERFQVADLHIYF